MERLLQHRYKLVRPVSALIDEDMDPCKLLVFRSNWDTEEPEQLTPVQATDPAPQGYEEAVAELQFQPEKVDDGQFDIPSLKAQRAFASLFC